jgi:hypothetical protein
MEWSLIKEFHWSIPSSTTQNADLRDPKGSSTEVISDWARDVAKKLNAVGYFECFKS